MEDANYTEIFIDKKINISILNNQVPIIFRVEHQAF